MKKHIQRDESALTQEEAGTDYRLKPSFPSCWITVDNISVYIHRTDEGVVVDLYPLHDEMGESLASTYAFFADAEGEEGLSHAQRTALS